MDFIGITCSKQKHFDQMFVWYRTINTQFRSMMKSGTTQQKLLILMDNYIESLKSNIQSFIRNANRCYLLAKAISGALFLFKDLNRTSTETHEYLIKICEILSFYTFLELKFSSKFSSSKVIIAERISTNYDIHLKDVNIFYTLRVFLCIPTLFDEKEIMIKIFQKYLSKNQHITQTELPDRLYCMYLIGYSKWISLESDNYERLKICDCANKNIRPMDSLYSNKSYAPFLPLYNYNDSDATKYILSNRININLLTRALKNDDYSKENTILIDLCGDDTRNMPIVLKDTNWTNISPSNEKNSSVKLESPTIIATIDLTDEKSSTWEVSWLNELLRKSRTSMPPIPLNVVTHKLVSSLEIISIEDDDEVDIVENSANVQNLSFNFNECEESLRSDSIKSDIRTISIGSNNIHNDEKDLPDLSKNNCRLTDSCSPKNRKATSIIDINEKADINSDESSETCTVPQFQINNINNKSEKNKIKTYERCQNYKEFLSFPSNDSYRTDYEKDIPQKKQNLPNVLVNRSDKTLLFSTSNNLLRTSRPRYINIDSSLTLPNAINEEDGEDINSPPIECFSESDADEFVKLIDNNTKESNATNLFGNRDSHYNTISQISPTPNLQMASECNLHMRKVSFAKLPEKHIATSNHFTTKYSKNMGNPLIINEYEQSTKLPASNTDTGVSSANVSQPKALCTSSEIISQSSPMQELVSSSDQTTLPNADFNRRKKVSGTIGSLFMMKFPEPTYQKLKMFDTNTEKKHNVPPISTYEKLRTDFGKTKTFTDIKKNDYKQYASDKKCKSDFDRYLDKLKEKRNKPHHIPKNQNQETHLSPINTITKKPNFKKIFNKSEIKENVLQFLDSKLQRNSYVKIERLNISQYLNRISKLNRTNKLKEERANAIGTSTNPFVRIKRIKNIKENTYKTHPNLLSIVEKEPQLNIISAFNNISEINLNDNNIYNSRIQSDTKTEVINKKNSSEEIEKNKKLNTSSQLENWAMYNDNVFRSDNNEGTNEVIVNQRLSLENEVTSTQDNVDMLVDFNISSTEDMSTKALINSIQNNEIDTSQQILVKCRRKRRSSSAIKNSFLPKTNLFCGTQNQKFNFQ